MTIEKFVDKVNSFEFEEIKDWSLEKLIRYVRNNKILRLYITKENYPIFVVDPEVIIEIFLNNLLAQKVEDFVKENNVFIIEANRHIIETYNFMRKEKLDFLAVIKDNKLIGEITFNTLSLKISYIAIKDTLTDTYNEKYFRVLVEEYNEIASDVGIVMVKILNLSIYEGLYGIDMVNKILKKVSDVLKNSIRDVDFLFRNDDVFKILTFNNAEITMKIKKRIEERLSDVEIDGIKILTKVVATQVPEIESNIILAIEELERKLIKGD